VSSRCCRGYRRSAHAPTWGENPIFPSTPLQRPTLITQVLAVNALIVTATVFAISVEAQLNADPLIEGRRLLVLVAALMAMVLMNGWLMRRRFAPLEQLIDAMEHTDLGERATRDALPAAEVEEVARLQAAFEAMLGRLEAERDRTASAVLQAQETERARVARDLHDEANQSLTGVLLRLAATSQHAPPALRQELHETQAVATRAMEELLRLSRELRPAALDDLGLGAALRSKVEDFGRTAAVDAALRVPDGSLDALGAEEQIVVYRIVQESLSNVARHARASAVDVEVTRDGPRTVVRITDDGAGYDPAQRRGGHGVTGMRERAALAGGRLRVTSTPGAGTRVELRLGGER
jgi:two-component system sensor histidine kinase UhpB